MGTPACRGVGGQCLKPALGEQVPPPFQDWVQCWGTDQVRRQPWIAGSGAWCDGDSRQTSERRLEKGWVSLRKQRRPRAALAELEVYRASICQGRVGGRLLTPGLC